MLTTVFAVLAERGWFDPTQPFEYSVHLTRGACVWLRLTRHGRSQTFVKFTRHVDLEDEARRSAEASSHHAGLAPRFLGWHRDGSLQVLAAQAVDHVALNSHGIRRKSDRRWLAQRLQPYFAAIASTRLPVDLTPLRNAALPAKLGAYFADHSDVAAIEPWLRSDAMAAVCARAEHPQHGDLAINNLGRVGDGLVIFDWEDYGLCSVPGLDLLTLEMSIADDAATLHAERGGVARPLLDSACDAMRLPLADYLDGTVPLALIFRYLKRRYGPEARARMDGWVRGLLAQAGAPR